MNINIKKIENGKLPEYKTSGASGADCFSRIMWQIHPREIMTIPLGFAVEIPEGYEMQIRPRSGLTKKGILIQFGTIDSDYRGEVGATLINNSDDEFMVEVGMRICQAVIVPVEKASWQEVEKLSNTKRGEKGFGSTGI